MPDEGKPKDPKKTQSLHQGIQETLEEAARVSDDLIDGLEAAPAPTKTDPVAGPKPKPRMAAGPREAISDTLQQLDFLVDQAQSQLEASPARPAAPVVRSGGTGGGGQDIDAHLDALLGGSVSSQTSSRPEPRQAKPKPATVAPVLPAAKPVTVAPVPPAPKAVTVAPVPPAPKVAAMAPAPPAPKAVTVAPDPPAPAPVFVAPLPAAPEKPAIAPRASPSLPPVQALECEIPDPLEALERALPELITVKAPRRPRKGIALAIVAGLILVAAATMWVRRSSPSPFAPVAPADGGPPVVFETPAPPPPAQDAAVPAPRPTVVPKTQGPPKPAAAAGTAKARTVEPKRSARTEKPAAPVSRDAAGPVEVPAPVVVVVPETVIPPPPAAEPPEPAAVSAPEPMEPADSDEPEVVASPPAGGDSPVVAILDAHQPPTLLRRVAPEIPTGALKAGEHATVVLSALVDEHGRVVRVVVEEGLPGNKALEAAAVNALLRWTFRPALDEGRPVRDWVVEKMVLEP